MVIFKIKLGQNAKVELSHEEKLSKAYGEVKVAIKRLEALGGVWE